MKNDIQIGDIVKVERLWKPREGETAIGRVFEIDNINQLWIVNLSDTIPTNFLRKKSEIRKLSQDEIILFFLERP